MLAASRVAVARRYGKIRDPSPSKDPAMIRRPSLSLWPLLVLAACSSAPEGVPDPAITEEAKQRALLAEETERKLGDPSRLLTDLDRQLDAYLRYTLASGSVPNEATGAKLDGYLKRIVKDYFDVLVQQADQTAFPRNRAIAACALGFSENPAALDPILNAAQDANPEVVINAVFGLGILADPRTPPMALTRVMDSTSFDSMARGGAAWALYKVQMALPDPAPVTAIWKRVVEGPLDEEPAEVLVTALRGIGQTRDASHRVNIERYVSHPTPLVRSAAAIALGRMNDAAAAPALFALIGPSEPNENVRLAARKALQALAGGVDRGYDVEEWKRVFERGV